MKCCGVDNAWDWSNGTDIIWDPSTANKPLGCCLVKQNGSETTKEEQEVSNVGEPPPTYKDQNDDLLALTLNLFLDMQSSAWRPW